MILRIRIVSFLFLICFCAIFTRLFYWQIYKGKNLAIEARGQYQKEAIVDALRGDILASDGSWFAASGQSWLLYATLPQLEKPFEEIAKEIASVTAEDRNDKKRVQEEKERILSLINRDNTVWVPLKARLDTESKDKIEAFNIKGIGFESQEKRLYPEASSAAHLLGFVGKDEQGKDIGYFGLEGYYDLILSGRPGVKIHEKDASGIPMLLDSMKEVIAIGGVNLLTHIDKYVQMVLEERLKAGIEKYGAKSGSVVVMNPSNGAILGMSSYPSYDPEKYWEYGDIFFKNPVISSSFEPGSVFKVVVMASALDSKVITPESKCDICSHAVNIDKYTISTWNDTYYPESNMTDIIVHSDNVGMVFVSQKLGTEKLVNYLKKFGIGENTGIDLQGETSPVLRDIKDWTVVDLATAGFGQGVAVTPIQMVSAVATIANGGKKVAPQVVNKIIGTGWEEDIKPVVGETVISERAASQITAMMVEAAKKGEAKWTYLKGFPVAGKTGTAQIPIEGHYDEEKTIASFVGFSPYNHPKFVMLVTLQEPQTSPWASETAAPLWYSIAKDLYSYFGIQPEN